MTALLVFIIFVLWIILYSVTVLVTEQVFKNGYWLGIANLIMFIFTFCVSYDIIMMVISD